jgi:murein DD-endopeptidase MepM/ murein hydrolase activator NlpD
MWRAALVVCSGLALLVLPVPAAGAADPVAAAEARVTAAQRAANDAARAYDDAQTSYYGTQDEIARTRERLAGLQHDADALSAVATARAVEAYKGGNANLEAIIGGNDVMDAMRRSALLNRVNAQGNNAVDKLGAMSEDLRLEEVALNDKLAQQREHVSDMRAKRAAVAASLAEAQKAERDLKARLEAQRRAAELQSRLQKARAAATAARGKGAAVLPRGGRSVVVSGGFQCPVPGSAFSDSFGAPRSGGRAHQGVDMMAGYGTAIYAVVSGSVSHSSSGLGGNQIWLAGSDGNKYFYAHLQAYVGGAGPVNAGDQIGRVGDSGNARGTPHLHFEIHPGGGAAVDPYPTVRAHC